MARLTIDVFGAPRVAHGERVLTFPTRKALALLVYLAVEPGRHARDKLSALFWPDSDDEHARTALRRALAFVRESLGDTDERSSARSVTSNGRGMSHLIVSRDSLALDLESDPNLDTRVLQAAWSLARSPSRPTSLAAMASLVEAASRYRGDFLDGFSLPDAPEFDDWASLQRELWHRRASLVLDRLSQWQADGGDVESAIDTTGRWVGIDPLSEAAHRRLIQIHFAAGDRSAALRAFENCRLILERELNAEPTPETIALIERVRAEAPRPSDARPGEPAIPIVIVEAPLVGRDDEHARLVELFRATRRGRTHGVVIEGESGIGKSRLATEFVGWARSQNAEVLRGRALETGGRLPYQPLVDALRERLASIDLGSLLPDIWLAELSRLLPDLADRHPRLQPQPTTNEAEARTRLCEAVTRLVQALATRSPVVLFVDDLQWADAASLDALRYLAQRCAATDTPVVLLFCVRSEDAQTDPELGNWLAALGRDLPATRISLAALTLDDTMRLVRSLAANAASLDFDTFGRWLFGETGGHPFFLTETVRSMVERGVLRLDASGGPTIEVPVAPEVFAALDGFLPSSVRAVVASRLARLPPTTRGTLFAAAVLGHQVEFDHLRDVAGLTDEDALSILDDLLARRLLRETSGIYVFNHDKIREVAYAEAAEARRRYLHRRALTVLESTGAPAAQLARHAIAGGVSESALRFSLAAGDEAMRLFAVRDAIGHYERARAMAARVPDDPAASIDLAHLYTQLGRAYEIASDFTRARETYEAMLAFARARTRPVVECAALNRLARLTAQQSFDLDQAMELLQQARQVGEASGDRIGLAETEWNLAQIAFYRSDFPDALAIGQRALAMARDLGSAEYVARALNQISYTELFIGPLASAATHAEEAATTYAALGNRALEVDSLIVAAHARILIGQQGEGLTLARQAREISLDMENRWAQTHTAFVTALGLLETGDYEEALATARAGVAVGRSIEFVPLLILNLLTIGAIYRALFAVDLARQAHLEAYERAQTLNLPVRQMFMEMSAGALCADYGMAGEWPQALEYAQATLAVRSHTLFCVSLAHYCETEALIRAGECDLADRDLRRMGEIIADSNRMRIAYWQARARQADFDGDKARALEHLERASILANEIGLPGEIWQIQASLGELYLAMGDERRAQIAFLHAQETVRILAAGIRDEQLRTSFLAAEPVRRILDWPIKSLSHRSPSDQSQG